MQDENDNIPGDGDQLPAPTLDDRVQPLARSRPAQPALRLAANYELADAQDEISVLDYWRIIVKRKWTVLGAFACVFFIALVGTLLMTPLYQATITLQIERDVIKIVDVEGFMPTESPLDRDFYQTQYELLKSRVLAERVIGQLNLAKNPVFLRMAEPSPWMKLIDMFKSDDAATTEEALMVEHSKHISVFLEALGIVPVRNSRLVRVSFDSPNPAFSARVINTLAETYITTNLERRFDASSYAKDYLEDRLQQLKLKLEDSERQLVGFAQKEAIIEIGNERSLSGQHLEELNLALAKAQDERFRAESKWNQAQSTAGMGLTEVLGSELIQALQGTRATLLAEYQQKLGLYKPSYPIMRQLKEQADEVDNQIKAEVANIKAAIQSQYRAAQSQEALLAKEMETLKSDVLDLRSRSIRYNTLNREVETNRQLYEGLLQRYKQIGVAGGVGLNNISIIDRAEVPVEKNSPQLLVNLGAGALLGLFCAVLLAFLMEHLDDTIKSPETLEKQLGLAVLGVVPKLRDTTPATALQDARSAFAEAYRSVRTALQFSTESGVPRSLLVTSATIGEGKTTTALTLARNFAQLGKRVLLIDADLRNPSLHKRFGLDNQLGLSNYLAGTANPRDLTRETDQPNLRVILTGTLPPNPAELLAGTKMRALLTIAVGKFDLVIMDSPPVMGLADAPVLANIAHGTLLVVESAETRSGMAKAALKRLLAVRARMIGSLLTKYDVRLTGYGYGYGYGAYGYYAYGEHGLKLSKR